MHVRTVVGPGTEPSDVELAQLLLLGQLNVMAEVAVVPLLIEKHHDVIIKCRMVRTGRFFISQNTFIYL